MAANDDDERLVRPYRSHTSDLASGAEERLTQKYDEQGRLVVEILSAPSAGGGRSGVHREPQPGGAILGSSESSEPDANGWVRTLIRDNAGRPVSVVQSRESGWGGTESWHYTPDEEFIGRSVDTGRVIEPSERSPLRPSSTDGGAGGGAGSEAGESPAGELFAELFLLVLMLPVYGLMALRASSRALVVGGLLCMLGAMLSTVGIAGLLARPVALELVRPVREVKGYQSYGHSEECLGFGLNCRAERWVKSRPDHAPPGSGEAIVEGLKRAGLLIILMVVGFIVDVICALVLGVLWLGFWSYLLQLVCLGSGGFAIARGSFRAIAGLYASLEEARSERS